MATPAGDIYALGIIAYEALMGQRPFTGSTQVDIAFAHVNEPVPELPESVPAEVRQIIMELLAKRPGDRPATARELARRLDRIVVNLPPDSWDPRRNVTWHTTGRPVQPLSAQEDAVVKVTSRRDLRAPRRPRLGATFSRPATQAIPRASDAGGGSRGPGHHDDDRSPRSGPGGLSPRTWYAIVVALVVIVILLTLANALASAQDTASASSTLSSKEAL
jgi:putative uncharacterized protein (fragment)